jgi:nitrite reductase (NADH) large subunit
MIYGLVAPGYEMARVLAARFTDTDARFTGADLSTTLKLLGVAVASFGDAFADETLGAAASRVVVEDRLRGVYQKLVVDESRRLLGGVLVGDADAYPTLVGSCAAAGRCPSARMTCWSVRPATAPRWRSATTITSAPATASAAARSAARSGTRS